MTGTVIALAHLPVEVTIAIPTFRDPLAIGRLGLIAATTLTSMIAVETPQLIGAAVLVSFHVRREVATVTKTLNVKVIWCVDQITVLATFHPLEVIGQQEPIAVKLITPQQFQ